MKSNRSHRLFTLGITLLLVCVVALSAIFLSTMKAQAAPAPALNSKHHHTPTPTPTSSVIPTPTPTSSVTPTTSSVTPTPTPTVVPGTACQVTYTIVAQFHSGFTAVFDVTNTGSATINGWTLQFTFPDGQTIDSFFNGNETQSGANVTIVNRPYNAVIPPGTKLLTQIGFTGNWNNIANDPPASFTLNGVVCSKG